ncbi:NahK/ErcS family hybrid sensor histidine kinase/response regulator [Dongia soli]|uniref:histidine kinase n=1 Tax=Dongia soli TaxID=600628 RepID=A0ABU5EJW4_9PROT|nr:NahK/ErcS family hybrid sensor histidine kinase/response regulator [Dongia soli]MDY0885528.1 NahK/ErcS family hybrid sensor histidine kinase/response regulator [Dongia soli]
MQQPTTEAAKQPPARLSISELERENAKLKEINRALMTRVEHSLDIQGNAYHLFQTAILLDRKVRDRTRELEQALQAVEISNQELNEAIIVSHTTQNRLQDAINSISEGFAIFDPQDHLILFNRRFLDFWPHLTDRIHTGITFDQLMQLALAEQCINVNDDVSHEDWIKHHLDQRHATRRGGANRAVYALSTGRWVQVNERRSIEGGIASIYTDITDLKDEERQEREKVLAETSAHLQATLESMSIGVAVFDHKQRLATANRRYGELLELPATLLTPGSSFQSFQAFNDKRGVPELGTGSLIATSNTTAPVEVSVNGRWFSLKRDPMPDGGFVISYAEITERRLAEEALHDSEERIRLFANAMPTMMCYIDDQEHYRFANRAYRANFSQNGGQIVGRTMRSVLGTHVYNARRPYIERALNGSTALFDLPLPSADGEERFGLATYVPHRNVHGQVVGFFTLIQDITERRRAQHILEAANEELERRVHERTASLQQLNDALMLEVEKRRRITRELRNAKIEAERANVSKTQFLADASHDLLQPLNAARLFIAAAQDNPLPDKLRPLLGKVDHALANVEDILNILLDISKLDAGHVTAEIQRVALAPLMRALRDDIAPLAEQHDLELTVLPSDQTVYTDPRLLRRLLQNFLTNACRYTPRGRILFGARRRGTNVELQVLDTGIGIPQDRLDDIFEEFHRLTQVDGSDKGYGLGLSIVRRISRLLHHPVQVHSTVDRGSLFSVLVPIADDATETVAPQVKALPNPSNVAGVRVLVVDNDPDILDGMTSLLDTWHCRVIAATDEQAAIDAIAQAGEKPDILLADYHLDNGRIGTDLIAAVRDRLGHVIPAAVITADRNNEVQEMVQMLPAVSLLLKPIKPARLRALIASVRQ